MHPFRRSRKDTLDALQDVSFQVEKGEFFGVVGRNGSGKSTLLKCMAGIYRADAGTIGIACGCPPSSSSASASTPIWPPRTTSC